MFMTGIVMFSSLVMLPQFLQSLMGYYGHDGGPRRSRPAGSCCWSRCRSSASSPTRVPARLSDRRSAGAVWSPPCVYTVRHLDLLIELRLGAPGCGSFRPSGCRCCSCPITLAAYSGLPPEKSNSASGMLNFMRNIGSSVGHVDGHDAGRAAVAGSPGRRCRPTRRMVEPAVPGMPWPACAHRVARAVDPPRRTRAHAYATVYRTHRQPRRLTSHTWTLLAPRSPAPLMFALSFALKKNPIGGGPDGAHDESRSR